MTKHKRPLYVWFNDHGTGRNQVAAFRLALDLPELPSEAILHVFADSAYQLYVNGRFVTFGPVRFDQRFPVHDSVDLKPHLRPGENVLAIEAKAFGVKTHKAHAGHGGMTAWGSIQMPNGPSIDLATGAADWRCVRHESYEEDASKLSFALDTVDIFDQAREPRNWKAGKVEDKAWPRAIALKDPSYWGELQPRSIPFMSLEPIPLPKSARVLPLKPHEDVFSFAVPTTGNDQGGHETLVIPYTTWIHSPRQQEVTLTRFWGDDSLNGQALGPGLTDENSNLRVYNRVHFRAGWNHYCGWVSPYSDVFSFFLGFPKECGLKLSPRKIMDDPIGFVRGPLLTKARFEESMSDAQPWEPEADRPEKWGAWIDCPWNKPAHDPCRWTSWDSYGPPFETMPCPPENALFPKSRYPDGFAILIDLGSARVTFPVLRLSGVEGAIIDVTYSEELLGDHDHLHHFHYYLAGDRILCARNEIEWRPSQPRGLRYLKITVRQTQHDVVLNSLTVESAGYPVVKRGSFKCSDPLLTRIWELCERTQAVNMEDAYVDCPGRERGMYAADTLIQYHVNLATFGDHALFRRCMELYGQSTSPDGRLRAVYPSDLAYTLFTFSLDLVEGYWVYYQQTGDATLLESYWPAILKNLQWYHELSDKRPDGLVETNRSPVDEREAPPGLQEKGVVKCLENCFYVNALDAAAQIARVLHDPGQEKSLRARAEKLRKSINANFWDEKKGLYLDRLHFTTHEPRASLLALRAGVVTPGQMPAIREGLRRNFNSAFVNGFDPGEGSHFGPEYAFYLFDGLYRAGLEEIVENLMHEGWGWMLNQGLKNTAEHFSLNRTHSHSSYCHAWASHPAYYLSREVLGVKFPELPNTNVVEIDIHSHRAWWAEGTYPHPLGEIYVKWERKTTGLEIEYRAPQGVEVRVRK